MIRFVRCWTGRRWVEFGDVLAIGFGPNQFIERISWREIFPTGRRPSLKEITDTVIMHRYDKEKAMGRSDEDIARRINDGLNEILASEMGLKEGRTMGRKGRRKLWLYSVQHGVNVAKHLNSRGAA